jgi:hypothetical protein
MNGRALASISRQFAVTPHMSDGPCAGAGTDALPGEVSDAAHGPKFLSLPADVRTAYRSETGEERGKMRTKRLEKHALAPTSEEIEIVIALACRVRQEIKVHSNGETAKLAMQMFNGLLIDNPGLGAEWDNPKWLVPEVGRGIAKITETIVKGCPENSDNATAFFWGLLRNPSFEPEWVTIGDLGTKIVHATKAIQKKIDASRNRENMENYTGEHQFRTHCWMVPNVRFESIGELYGFLDKVGSKGREPSAV